MEEIILEAERATEEAELTLDTTYETMSLCSVLFASVATDA